MDGYTAAVANGTGRINDAAVAVPGVVIERVVGDGANGLVFAGSDELGRSVAVKVWPPRKRRTRNMRELQEKAFAETRKVAELKHESLVTVYRAGLLENGWPYVVMEFAPG